MNALNARFEDLVDAIGLPATLRLVEAVGGKRVYLPHPSRVRADSDLARAIGVEAVGRLAALWPSKSVTFPRASEHLRRARDRSIRLEKGALSIAELALKYKLTERQIYSIVARRQTPKPTPLRALYKFIAGLFGTLRRRRRKGRP